MSRCRRDQGTGSIRERRRGGTRDTRQTGPLAGLEIVYEATMPGKGGRSLGLFASYKLADEALMAEIAKERR